MNPYMFLIGAVIFSAYLFFLLWSITYSNKKQREENYPNMSVDNIDMDGIGNYGRIPNKKPKYVSKWDNVPGRKSRRKR